MEHASFTHLRDEGARVFIFQLLLVRGVEDRFQRAAVPPGPDLPLTPAGLRKPGMPGTAGSGCQELCQWAQMRLVKCICHRKPSCRVGRGFREIVHMKCLQRCKFPVIRAGLAWPDSRSRRGACSNPQNLQMCDLAWHNISADRLSEGT